MKKIPKRNMINIIQTVEEGLLTEIYKEVCGNVHNDLWGIQDDVDMEVRIEVYDNVSVGVKK